MKVRLFTTWHPAYLFQDKSRAARSFVIHIDKAVRIAEGAKRDKWPKIHYNPSVKDAKRILDKWKEFAVDIETPKRDDYTILSLAVCGSDKEALVWHMQDPRQDLRVLREALRSKKRKVFQNADFDVTILNANGWAVPLETLWDTMLEHQMWFPDEPANLSFLTSLVTDIEAWKYLRAKGGKTLLRYNAIDAWTTWRVYTTLPDPDLVTPEMQEYVAYRMPTLGKTIIPLNQTGVKLDVGAQRALQKEWEQKARTWKKRLIEHCEEYGFEPPLGWKGGKKSGHYTENISSKKAKDLLYGVLGLPEQVNAKDGRVTVGKDFLPRIEDFDHTGTVTLLLERTKFRDVETPLKIRPDADGIVRTRYVFGGDEKHDIKEVGKESPASGRLASREPNLQNVKEWVRKIFISRFGWLLKADYSQIELRLIAWFSGDENLWEAVETDAHLYMMYLVDQETDLHGLWKDGYEELYRRLKAGDPVVKAARKEQKRVNFGWPYRMGAKKVENQYGVPVKRAQPALDALASRFYKVVRWWDSLAREVRKNAQGSGWGYLVNPFGRVRRFFLEDVPAMCAFLPSSTAADVLYDAMDMLNDVLPEYGSLLVLTVHDEVVLDTPCPKELAPKVREIMERPIPQLGDLVIPVDIQVGRNWAEATKENKDGQVPFEKWRRKYDAGRTRKGNHRNRGSSTR